MTEPFSQTTLFGDDVVWVAGVYGPIPEADHDIDDIDAKSIGDTAFEELRQEQGLPPTTQEVLS